MNTDLWAKLSLFLFEAQVECPKGHELTAFSARPPDYRKFDGPNSWLRVRSGNSDSVFWIGDLVVWDQGLNPWSLWRLILIPNLETPRNESYFLM